MDPTDENENAVLPLVTRSKSAVNWPVDVQKITREIEKAGAAVIREGIGSVEYGRDAYAVLTAAKRICALRTELNQVLDDIGVKIDEDARMIEQLNTEREEAVRRAETLGVLAKETKLVELLDEHGAAGLLRVAQLGIQWEDANQNDQDMGTVLMVLAEHEIEGNDLDDHLEKNDPKALEKFRGGLADIAEVLGKISFED